MAPARSTAQFDLLSVRSPENNAPPALLARLACVRLMRCSHDLNAARLQLGNRLIETVGLEAEVKAVHRSLGPVRQLQHGIAELEIGNMRTVRNRLSIVVLESKIAFIERDRS